MRVFIPLAAALALAGCGTLPQPFYGDPGKIGAKLAVPPAPVLSVPTPTQAMLDDKSAPLFAQDIADALANQNDVPSIVRPPVKQDWHLTIAANLAGTTVTPAYTIVGPDLKTYGTLNGAPVSAAAWSNGDPQALTAAAQTDAVAIAKRLGQVSVAMNAANPNSPENRTPRVYMGVVTGAPGDGDNALALNMQRDLPGPFLEAVTVPGDADFWVTGIVKTTPAAGGQIIVELDWSVRYNGGVKIGQITQLHQLNPQDITPYWGDVAAAAAQEAATGVQQVIGNAVAKTANAGGLAPPPRIVPSS